MALVSTLVMIVITGVDPVIHAFFRHRQYQRRHVDCRNKSGNDDCRLWLAHLRSRRLLYSFSTRRPWTI